MAKISKKGAKGHHTYSLTLTEVSTSVNDNTSTINYSFVIVDDSNYFWSSYGKKISYSLKANGSTIASGYIPNHTSKTETIKSGTFIVPHNDDGTKTIDYSFEVIDNANQSYTSGNASSTGTLTLAVIPRYLTIEALNINSLTETTAVVNWNTSDPTDEVLFSLDNGISWINSTTYGSNVSDDKKSGSFNIHNLSDNTNYNLVIKARRIDSGLYSESNTNNFTTYSYPYCLETPDFTIGTAVDLNIYNPLQRPISIVGICKSNNVAFFEKIDFNGNTLNCFNEADNILKLYSSIPNSQEGFYKIDVIYNSNIKTTDNNNKYCIQGSEIPTIEDITYQDSDTSVSLITQNNQHIVQNVSNLKVSYTNAAAKNGASIFKCTFELNGVIKESFNTSDTIDFGKVNVSNDVDLIVNIIDSRGLIYSTTKKILILSHDDPKAIVTLNRLNNYEDTTYLTVDGSISSVDSKNSMTIKYRYKESNQEYNEFITIADKTQQVLILDKNKVYIFNILITDVFGGVFNKEFVLNKGVFPFFVDTILNSIGINCFPSKQNSLEINSIDILGIFNAFNNSIKSIFLNNDDGLKINIKNYGTLNKMPILILGADSSNPNPVITVVNFNTLDNFGYINLGTDKVVTKNENAIHINASSSSYYFVIAPPVCELELFNSTI